MNVSFGPGQNAKALMSGHEMHNYLTSIDIGRTGEALDTTVLNSSFDKSYIPGKVDATLSGDGLFDATADVEDALSNALASSTHQVWTYYPQGWTAGNYGSGLETLETTYDIATPVDGVVSISVEAQSKVAADRIISHYALTTIGTSGTGASVDNSAASTLGGVGYFQRNDNSTRGVTGTIQHSSAGTSWADIVSFSSSRGRGGQRVAMSGSVKRYTRAWFDLSTGSTQGVTIHYGFGRK